MTPDFSLYLVVQADACGKRDIKEVVAEAVEGGVSAVQLREKHLSDRMFWSLARELKTLLDRKDIPLIINDRVDVALALGAAGVHLGQSDLPYSVVRSLLGPHRVIGLSVENEIQLREADLLQPDYVALSPLFDTVTKKDLGKPWGIEGLRRARKLTALPLLVIGGVSSSNAAAVRAAGADGIAVVSAICGEPNAKMAATALKSVWGESAPKMRPVRSYYRALTIAGSDSGGGAGIQADLKTFSALGVYGMSVITAITAQNTTSVTGIADCPAQVVSAQIRAVLSDIGADAIKIGMLFNEPIIEAVAAELKQFSYTNTVLDPVMIAKSGDALLQENAREALVKQLFPLTRILTPNLFEAEALLGQKVRTPEEMTSAAKALASLGPKSVLLKGGHRDAKQCDDCFFDAETGEVRWFEGPRLDTKNTHGTGCSLSSAIAAFLAKGEAPVVAVGKAKQYLSEAIRFGAAYRLGEGHGPVHHFWPWWGN